jgi:hypothetical protein
MARESIAMPREEWLDFLAAQRWMVLGTLEPDGGPWARLAPAALEAETLYFAVPLDSRDQRNLERDPRTCCASDQFPSYYEIRGATVHGRAQRIEEPAALARLAPRLDASGLPGWPEGAELAIWSLPLDDVFSFDFGRIRNRV